MNTIPYTLCPLGYMFTFAGTGYLLGTKQEMIEVVTRSFPTLEFNFVMR